MICAFVSQQANHQVESLQQQLRAFAEQRDNAIMQLANAQEMASQYANSLANLQMVLEQFQHGEWRHLVVDDGTGNLYISNNLFICGNLFFYYQRITIRNEGWKVNIIYLKCFFYLGEK